MIKSMTGFGQAKSGKASAKWRVEIRSWNHRFFEFSINAPLFLNDIEPKVRGVLREHIRRGKVVMSLSQSGGSNGEPSRVIDDKKIEAYIRAVRNVKRKYGLKGELDINSILSIPEIFLSKKREVVPDSVWSELKPVVEQAAKALAASRLKEGMALHRDMSKRIAMIRKSAGVIEKVSLEIPEKRYERLRDFVAKLLEGRDVAKDKIEREIAVYVERSDITEELVRIENHLVLFEKAMKEGGEAGKKLDFLAQELHREVNTIASKSQNSDISAEVIQLKSEIEKIREQVQNIE